jgi:hypothetical protein
MRTGTAAARPQHPAARHPGLYAARPAEVPARHPPPAAPAPVPRVLRYHRELGDSPRTLVGYVMDLGYDDGVVVTNDYYKVRVGGLSKNSFLLVRPGALADLVELEAEDDDGGSSTDERAAEPDDLFELLSRPRSSPTGVRAGRDVPPHLILARVLEPAATPLSQEAARVYFELRKTHAGQIDPFTRGELQWGAMKVAVLGTFYDERGQIVFGGDVQTFLSPHLYSVHVPPPAMLQELVNAFVEEKGRRAIGSIRLSESVLTASPASPVSVYVSPQDFVGTRTALFGKTRTGKSNTVKLIAQMVLDSVKGGGAEVGQVVFDLNGEYAYRNNQDRTSLFDLYADRCVRYSLRPEPPAGVRPLKADFYGDLELGHHIIREMFRQQEGTSPPDYMKGFLEWEPLGKSDLEAMDRDDPGASTRYRRQESLYRCILHEAGFEHRPNATVRLHLNKDVRADVAMKLPSLAEVEQDGNRRVPQDLPLHAAAAVYKAMWDGYDPSAAVFATDSGKEYLDETAKSMMTVVAKCRAGGGGFVSGYSKLVPLKRYHCRDGGRLLDEIVEAVDASKTVIIDLSNAPEELAAFFGGMVCGAVFKRQMDKFTSDRLGEHFVQFYFEEAHNLFPRDDRDLRNIYNRLAKEGAKLNIGLVYSTQSIESLSPDLLKNTENFFIAHLNDDREIRALTRFHEFRDVGADVQRTKARGFVRMITRSHRFALPVQVRKFGPGD